MILSRSSSVKPSTACASPGLSTRRVLLAAATLRFSSATSGLFPGMCSDSNGSSAWPRRWKPHAARSAASTQAKAAREEPSNDHIDEPSGDHDDLLHRLAVREARHSVVSEGELLELLALAHDAVTRFTNGQAVKKVVVVPGRLVNVVV